MTTARARTRWLARRTSNGTSSITLLLATRTPLTSTKLSSLPGTVSPSRMSWMSSGQAVCAPTGRPFKYSVPIEMIFSMLFVLSFPLPSGTAAKCCDPSEAGRVVRNNLLMGGGTPEQPHGPGIGSGTEPARSRASGGRKILRTLSSLKKMLRILLSPRARILRGELPCTLHQRNERQSSLSHCYYMHLPNFAYQQKAGGPSKTAQTP